MRGPIPATMVDLSATGCRLKSSDLPAISVNVKISLIEHGLELRAERRWQNGELSGWRFVYNLKELERARKVLEEQQKRNRPASG